MIIFMISIIFDIIFVILSPYQGCYINSYHKNAKNVSNRDPEPRNLPCVSRRGPRGSG